MRLSTTTTAATGLVSLNVHEALTFDAEIVLHPDLFGSDGQGGSAVGGGGGGSSSLAGGGGPPVGTSSFSSSTVVAGTTTAAAAPNRPVSLPRIVPIHSSGSSDQQQAPLTVAPAASAAAPISPRLKPGDFVEIKVWDPLPRNGVASPEDRASLRRRSSPPTSKGSFAMGTTTAPTVPAVPPPFKLTQQQPGSGQSSTASLPKVNSAQDFSPAAAAAAATAAATAATNSSLVLKEAASTLQLGLSNAPSEEEASSMSGMIAHASSGADDATAPSLLGGRGLDATDEGSVASRSVVRHSNSNLANDASAATTPVVSPKSCLTDDPSSSAKQHTPPPPGSGDALPPVFPRNLLSQPLHIGSNSGTGTGDGPAAPPSSASATTTPAMGTAALLPPKPPALSAASRRNTIGNPLVSSAPAPTDPIAAPSSASKLITGSAATTTPATTTSATFTPSRATSNSVPSTALRPRHFRDLSDMTIDTVYDTKSTTVLEGSHQVTGELQVPLTTNVVAAGAARTTSSSTGVPVRDLASMTPATTTDDDEDETTLSHLSATHSERLSFVMKVGEASLTSLKGSARTQVSLLRAVADLYHLSNYDTVTIRRVDAANEKERLQAHRADFVLVTIKDQFISRGEMHSFLQDTLVGSWVYEGQRLFEASRNIQAHARQIRHQDLKVPSGIVTDETKITFRSRSARFVWLVQMSSEMWEYASPYERNLDESKCETYFDKWITFVRRLFDKWKEFEVTHSLTVVFFSRTFIGESPPIWYAASQRKNASPTKDHDIYGRHFEDHFRIVIENETSSDWDSLVVRLKEAFVRYPCEVGWNLATGADARRPSSASQGNVMESINVTLNLLSYHYLDRDLHRTGNSIVIISAGNGVFEVDKGLAAITYERMMVNGIGSDMLSLALPPLHTAPFFLYVNDQISGGSLDFGGTYYEVPHWMHLSFVNYNSEERFVAVDVAHQPKRAPPCVLEIDGRPVLANGFLLPRVVDPKHMDAGGNSPLIRPAGAAPASPVKQSKIVSQERQLIAGRDFNDILEACRPRNSAALPSALRSLLRTYHIPEPLSFGHNDDKVDTTDDLPEWGSIDHDSSTDSPSRQSHHRRVVALGQEPGVDLSPGFGPLPAPGGSFDGDQAEKESVASSYGSQQSSGIGVAYDRAFVNNKSSPTLAGVQVQKSASLDFFFHDDDKAGSGNETDSANSNTDSSSSVSARRAERRVKRKEKLVARLKKEMRQHDEKLLAVEAPKSSKAPDDSKHSAVNFGGSTQASHAGSRSGKQSGGIGAVLSQYRSTSSGSSIPEYFEGPSSVSRVASTTRLTSMSHSKMIIPEMGSRGMSPLILPPVTLSSSEIPASTSRRVPLEQRLVHRTDYSRSGFESSSRMTGKTTSSSLSRSPPIASSPGLAMSMMSSSSAHRQRPITSRSSIYQSKQRKSRQKKAFNPFRQEDEEEVLAKKSHNRRRWSHVFPLGEVEFKRHAGPNWKSLSSPAILPLFVDYFPSQQEVDHNFTFNYYNITLSEFEDSPYSSNQDFLMEMVRQRLTQDYQLVPLSHVNASNYRRQSMNRPVSAAVVDPDGSAGITRQFLSMGHRLQVLTYDPSADVIEVTIYDAKTTREASGANSFMYRYHCFCQETQSYSRVVQTFEKYADPYNWNKVDRIICGDEQRELREGMRFKRLMFVVIPDQFQSNAEEMQLVTKFQRLLEYLNKLRDRGDDSSDQLDVKIVTSADRQRDSSAQVASTVGVERGMRRFYVRLRKGKLDKLEWMEIVIDATFDTLWSYRIMFHWLVAGSAKVETQVQLLQRRCSQFGLTLVPIPQISVSRSIYVGPFKAPAIITIRDSKRVPLLDELLADLGFLHDGVFYTDARVVAMECLDEGDDFDFGKRWSRPPVGRQFLHRSGSLFVRIVSDLNGTALVVALGNYLYMSKDPKLRVVAQNVYHQLSERIDALVRAPS